MRIEHIAVWVSDLERMKRFYEKYFGAVAGNKYENPGKDLESYFLKFGNGARLEIMKSRNVVREDETIGGRLGLAILRCPSDRVKKSTRSQQNLERMDSPWWVPPDLRVTGITKVLCRTPKATRLKSRYEIAG